MVTAKEVIDSIKPNRHKMPSSTPLGHIGYDNVRDDIERVKKMREGLVEKTPTLVNDIANKAYVDAALGGGSLWEVDGTETQLKTADEIDMQTKKIINVVDPTANQEAATKKYVDDAIDNDVAHADTTGQGVDDHHNETHNINSHTMGDNKIIHTKAAGAITEISLGASGSFLTSGGAAADMTFTAEGDIDHDGLTNFAAGEHFTMLDEDNMATDSNTQAATQQSIKKYVDDEIDSDITTHAGDDDAHHAVFESLVGDLTPQLGGDLDMNAKGIDFPSTANITDCKDEDDLASDSATMLATQQSIKKYVDDEVAGAGGGEMELIGAYQQPAQNATFTSGAINTSGYRFIIIRAHINMTAANAVMLVLNGDTTVANYDSSYHDYSVDTHGTLTNNNNFSLATGGGGNVARIIDGIIYQHPSTAKHLYRATSMNETAAGGAVSVCGLWDSTAEITSIALYGNGAQPITTSSYMVLYGIK